MKIKTRNKSLLFILSILFIVCLSLAFFMQGSKSVQAQMSAVEFENEYMVGEVVEIPSATMTMNGETKEANVAIYFPNGTKMQGDKFTVEMEGEYTVRYTAEFNGKIYIEDKKFIGIMDGPALFSSTGKATANSAVYPYGGTLTSTDSQGNLAGTELLVDYKGVQVNLFSANDVITYDKVVRLGDNTKEDVLIDLVVVPEKRGTEDFSEYCITLTDFYDSSNYVTVTVYDSKKENSGGGASYIFANAHHQSLMGSYYTANGYMPRNGQFYYWGTQVYSGFRGYKSLEAETDPTVSLKIHWDNDEKTFYASPNQRWITNALGSPYAKIADLDSGAYFPGNTWNGFSSDKVILSVTAKNIKTKASLLISEIDGMQLSNDKYEDNNPPKIDIDMGGQESVPVAKLGEEYTLFPAIVDDDYTKNCLLTTKVYYHGAISDVPFEIQVINGKFKTDYIGKYTIEYTAKDATGNITKEMVEVKCSSYIAPISLDFLDKIEEGVVGENIPLATYETTGGSGKLNVTVKVIDPDNKEVVVNGDVFFPIKAGKYTATFTARDYLQAEKNFTYTIMVEKNTMPMFNDNVRLPVAVIKNFTYTFPVLTAIDYMTGTTLNSTLKVNGVSVSGPYKVETTETNLTLEYTAIGSEETAVKRIVIPVVDVGTQGSLDLSKYFYSEDATAIVAAEHIELETTKDTKIDFIRELSSNDFSIKMNVNATKSAFKSFTVTLEDGEKVGKKIAVEFIKSGSEILASLNGDAPIKVAGSFNGTSSYIIAMTYNPIDNSFSDSIDNIFAIAKTWLDGTVFDGFSNSLYMSISMKEVFGASAIQILNINGQAFGDYKVDTTKPQININSEKPLNYSVGQNVLISSATAYDVLGEITNVKLTVTLIGSNDVISDVNGNVLQGVDANQDYQFKAVKDGRYRIVYSVADNFNKQNATIQTLATVNELEKPTIQLSGNVPSSGKVGKPIKLPNATVEDNSGVATLRIMVVCPNDAIIYAENNVFIPDKVGVYVVRYFVYDTYFNCTIVEYKINVTK